MTPLTAIGDAYTSPSTLIDLMTFSGPVTRGIDPDTPLCEGAPWYIGQLGGLPAVPPAAAGEVCWAAVGGREPGGSEVDAWLPAPVQPMPASASKAMNPSTRRALRAPRPRCVTPHLYHC